MLCLFPARPTLAGSGQDVDAVATISVAVTAVVPLTAVFGSEKHPFVNAGLLVTVHVTVPVYPFCGVTVTVDVPAVPDATVTFVAATVNDLGGAETVTETEPFDPA